MKKIEILINGTEEERTGHEILAGIYAMVQNYGQSDISVMVETFSGRKKKGLEIPLFMTRR